MPFIIILQNTENARAEGELSGLIPAPTVWYGIFAAGFHFYDMYFCNFQNKSRNLFIIPNRKPP